MSSDKERLLFLVTGSVQGVGFRPFVYRLAHEYGLTGSVKNTSLGVEIEVEGPPSSLRLFQQDLLQKKPERAFIRTLETLQRPLKGDTKFFIAPSSQEDKTTLALLADTALCSCCLKELWDKNDRRYRYPFLHCMTCGPRFSLFLRMPFDRDHTTMRDFSPCPLCQEEYQDPKSRRFYSQTNCCPACGPTLSLWDSKGHKLADEEEALFLCIEHLKAGQIIACKNTGGFLLLADATREDTILRLRKRKQRPKKPFALLVQDLAFVERITEVDLPSAKLLSSPQAPIVLLKKKDPSSLIAPSVSSESPYYGVMLPHTALQHLLLEALKTPLVATSGNRSDQPLCIDEIQALSQLSPVADFFLVHNRRIVHRVDDSVAHMIREKPMLLRRARGYVPSAYPFPCDLPPLFAAGGQGKNTFAFAKDRMLYVSQHIGDLDSSSSCQAYEEEVKSLASLLAIEPSLAVGDLHPDYYTSHYLEKHFPRHQSIQHHEAHVYSCMIDHSLTPPLLAFAFDGTGLGHDVSSPCSLWGGECFVVTRGKIEKVASLAPFPLPGAERAIREPRRSALGLLYSLSLHREPRVLSLFSQEEYGLLCQCLEKNIHTPLTSSIGRLFDAVSALLGLCTHNAFEGHGALALEKLAQEASSSPSFYPMPLRYDSSLWLIDPRSLVEKLLADLSINTPPAQIALAFHESLSYMIVEIAKKVGLSRVLLTGGVFQNKLLAERTIHRLTECGFHPHWHETLPPNDGGLSAGQAGALLYNTEEYHVLSPSG